MIETEEVRSRRSWQYFHFYGTARDAFKDKKLTFEGLFWHCERSKRYGFARLSVDNDGQRVSINDFDEIEL